MKKASIQINIIGLLLASLAIIGSTLFGFGGFSTKTFTDYVLIGYVSRLEIIFLSLAGLGFILSGIGTALRSNNLIQRSKFLLPISYLAVGIIFLTLAIFGGTSQLTSSDFWANTYFKKIQDFVFFNNLSLISFLAVGILQLVLLFTLINNKFSKQNRLLKAAKILILISGILWIMKSIIDYPIIKEVIFVLSYELKFPFPNNILSILIPLVYLSSQILYVIILLSDKNLQINSKSNF